MPDCCAAYGCQNRRNHENRLRGITFHKFPSDAGLRRQWEEASRRGFVAPEHCKLCSAHFTPENLDRTGQIVRLRQGAVPSLFNFPSNLLGPGALRKAEESLPTDLSQNLPKREPPPNDDHSYAVIDSPRRQKARLSEVLTKEEGQEWEELVTKPREQGRQKTVKSYLGDLKINNLIMGDLQERLDLHSELHQHFDCLEEQFFNQETNCLEQEEPEPPQAKVEPEAPQVKEEQEEMGIVQFIKEQEPEPPQVKEEPQELESQIKEEPEEPEPSQTEELQGLGTSQEGEQLMLKLDSDSFRVPSIEEQSSLSEPEEVPDTEQLLSHDSEVQDVNKHLDQESTRNAELKKVFMVHSYCVYNVVVSEKQAEGEKHLCEETCGEIVCKKRKLNQEGGTLCDGQSQNRGFRVLMCTGGFI